MTEDSPRNDSLAVLRGSGKQGGLAAAAGGGLAISRTDDVYIQRPPTGVPNIWRIAYNALRGRYALILGLSVLSAAGLGAFAWRMTPPPTYPGEGLVRIANSLPIVRVATEHSDPLPMFETFMQSQKTLITSRRVIEMAILDRVWHSSAVAVLADRDLYFARHLTVDIKPQSELIHFSVHDRDAPTAAAAVTAIINAYTELYNSQDKQLDNQRLNLLEGSQKELRAQIDALTEALRAKAQAYGTTQLDASFLELQNRRNRVEGALNDIRITMAESGGVATPGQPPHAATSAKVRWPSPPRHHSLTARRNMRSITSAARAPQPLCVSGSLRSEFASNVRGFECRPRHEASA